MYIDFCVIVIQPMNIGEQQRKGKMFTTIARVKDLNDLRFKLHFSYNRYEMMTKSNKGDNKICRRKQFEINHNEDYL